MDCYDSITGKLKTYLINEKGFTEDGEGLTKTLSNKEDMIYSKDLFKLIFDGKIAGGMEFAYGTMEDNYKSIIEENFDEWINLTDEEKAYLEAHEMYEDADDDDEDTGWDAVDQWILDCVEITADRSVVDAIARKELA